MTPGGRLDATFLERLASVIADVRASGERIALLDFVDRLIGHGEDFDGIAKAISDPAHDLGAIVSDNEPVTAEQLREKLRARREAKAAADNLDAVELEALLSGLDAASNELNTIAPDAPEPAANGPEADTRASAPADNARFLKLPHRVIRSPQFLALSFEARALLLDLGQQFSGKNNGDLSAPHSRLKSEGFASDRVLARAKAELEAAGFIVATGHAGRRGRPCQLYAITWLPINACGGKLDIPAEATARDTWMRRPPGAGTQQARKPGAAPAHALALAA